MNTYRDLPPLSTLIGFEAAARLQSFSRAAEELHITAIGHQPSGAGAGRSPWPTAVSPHRAADRTGRCRARFPDHGAVRAGRTAPRRPPTECLFQAGIGHRDDACRSCDRLVPATLAHLRDTHPWIDPWVHTRTDIHVPEEAEIDIVLGPLPWPDAGRAIAAVWQKTALIPLCAPHLAARLPDLPDRDRLDTAPLLHDETLNDWQSWFRAAGSARTEFSPRLQLFRHRPNAASGAYLALAFALRRPAKPIGPCAMAVWCRPVPLV